MESWGLNQERIEEGLLGEILENTLVINVQGDQPFIDPNVISKMHQNFLKNPKFQIMTPVYKLNKEDIHNPNVVKTLIRKDGTVIYFSRTAIPHIRDVQIDKWHLHATYWGHAGIYGFRADILSNWYKYPFSKIEELSNEIRTYFNSFLEKKLFDHKKINDLKDNLKKSIDKINKIYS